MAKKQKSRKTATDISPGVETRIVEVSLRHPEYGARRLLPFLEQEGIVLTDSAVYTILKRNNLQNKSLRLSKFEEQHSAGMVPQPAAAIEPPAGETVPVPADSDETIAPPEVTSVSKVPSQTKARRLWSLNPLNILLLGLVGYFWVSALGNLLEARRESTLPHNLAPVAVETKPQATVRPLEDYSIIVERNLFGGSALETPAPEEMVSIEDVPAAEKNLGLKLVGTVAGDDSATSFAIIDNKTTRKQELYHEGDKAGDVLIKRILRNKVIVDAGRGDELLALELEETGKKLDLSLAAQPPLGEQEPPPKEEALQLDRAQVEAALGNVDQVIHQLNISPFEQIGRPAGFRIGKIPADSILVRMGLRTGDLITGVNDLDITTPEQAAEFLNELKQGGEVIIKLRKSRGVRKRSRLIHLKIQ